MSNIECNFESLLKIKIERCSTMLPQEADGGRQLLAEAVDLLKRADETEAGPGRCRHAVMAVQGLTAVVATADADP